MKITLSLVVLLLLGCSMVPDNSQGVNQSQNSQNTNQIINDPEISYNNGVANRIINDIDYPGTGNYYPAYYAGVYFSSNKIADNIGKTLSSVKFYYACQNGTGACIAIHIYSNSNYQPGNQIVCQGIQQFNIVNGWNTVNISTSIQLPSTGIWIVLEIAPWNDVEGIVSDSSTSIYQDGIDVNQIDNISADSKGFQGNLLININCQ